MLLEGVLLNDSCDRWSWGLTSSGDFSVASIRKAIDDKRLPNVSSKTRWVKEVLTPPKPTSQPGAVNRLT